MISIAKLEGTAALLAGAVIAAALVYLVRKAPSAAAVGAALNPFNPDNIASTAANRAVQAVTGDPNQTAGGWVFDVFNPGAGLGANESVNPDGSISVQTAPAPVLPSAGMGDDYGWWFGGSYSETPAGAVTGRIAKP